MNSREYHSGLTVAFILLVVLIVLGLSLTMQRARGAEVEILCPAAGSTYCGKCYEGELVGPGVPYGPTSGARRVRAPEIDAAGSAGALTLLCGLLAVMRGKR